MFKSIGFIGAGRVAHIMLGGWKEKGAVLPPVVVCDSSPEALAALTAAFPQVRVATLEEVAGQALVFAAVHPPARGETLARIAPHLKADAVLVSLAPKMRLPALQEKLGGFARLARMNPNAPGIIGQGFNPVSLAPGLHQDARAALLGIVAPLGASPVVDDPLIETCAVISAMGPTYFWFQFDALRTMAEGFGMSPELAREAMRTMLHGAVDTLFASDLPVARVMDLVPVRPLAAEEEAIKGMLRERVGGIHTKLTT
jgi:pyrroline-5-carboxylate reductase